MIELKGKYTNAVIYADTIEEGVIENETKRFYTTR